MHTRPNVRIPAGAPLARTLVADEHAEQQRSEHVERDETIRGEEVAAPVVLEAGGGDDVRAGSCGRRAISAKPGRLPRQTHEASGNLANTDSTAS
jgi:hypothetical protein